MEYEQGWDRRLQIYTSGLDEANADPYRFRYEPTPYCVLERLADSGLIRADDTVLDYGCGKGRVGFFLAHRTGAATIGIEYDPGVYQQALENQKTAAAQAADFVLTGAELFAVPDTVNRCYFFNPFSVEILHKVIARLTESYYAHPREILLFFYYPSEEYLSYLMTVDVLEFHSEISCGDLFDRFDARERIVIFSFPDYRY